MVLRIRDGGPRMVMLLASAKTAPCKVNTHANEEELVKKKGNHPQNETGVFNHCHDNQAQLTAAFNQMLQFVTSL